ncbi:MAG TPA: PHP domain-containing protein, partial [Candidatus Methylomirabilis sp.]|nr:PHP domain-containing protein [Candidatus Methylomirabilis sp.]
SGALRLVPGIELSAMWGQVELHLLGYFFDPADSRFLGFLCERRSARRVRLGAMLSRLQALGIVILADDVLALAQDGNVGRPHLARVLVERGVVGSLDEAFLKYLGDGKPAYVPRPDLTIAEAIRAIHEAGGVTSLAHPGLHNHDGAFPHLVEAGLDAVEVYHVAHSPAQVRQYRRLSQRWGLVVTGGSDFHGVVGSYYGAAPGLPCLPEEDFSRLEAVAARHASVPRE